MGIFTKKARQIEQLNVLAERGVLAPIPAPALSFASPWSPQDSLLRLSLEGFIGDEKMPMSRERALRVPGVKRSHSIVCGLLAGIPLRQMLDDVVADTQPAWISNSQFPASPYHRLYGVASDFFFYGWALLAFNEDRTDCVHVPFGMWESDDAGRIVIDNGSTDRIPAEYHAIPVAIPMGYGDNGLLEDGKDTIDQAIKVEAAYVDRLDNPIPLTVLTIDADRWDGWQPEERTDFRQQWVDGRRSANGATAMKPSWMTIDMPGQVQVDLYETGRNGVRIDIANHVGLPVSMIEGVRQGGSGGGVEMTYSGVQNGASRNEVWDYGSPRRMLTALESRLSMDDVCEPGYSIRGDLTSMLAVPTPTTNPTSED